MSNISTPQILKGLFSLRLVRSPLLVKHAEFIMNTLNLLKPSQIAQRMFLKQTVFAHFCVGETLHEAAKTMKLLQQGNIYSILDYAAEAPTNDSGVSIDYESSVSRTKESLKVLCENSDIPMLATKITGFGSHASLRQATDIVQLVTELFRAILETDEYGRNLYGAHEFDQYFGRFVNYEKYDEFSNSHGFLSLTEDEFLLLAEACNKSVSKHMTTDRMTSSNIYKEGHMSLFALHEVTLDYLIGDLGSEAKDVFLKILKFISPKCHTPIAFEDYDLETTEVKKILTRLMSSISELPRLASEDESCDPFVLIDAEYYDSQAIMDVMSRYATTKINRPDKALIGNTYQCYLKETASKLKYDILVHKELNKAFGAKLVRGAYLSLERLQADSEGRPDPLNDTKLITDNMYDDCASELVGEIMSHKARAVFGTHNVESTQYIIQESMRLEKAGLHLKRGSLMVGQLLGMRDKLTRSIADSNVIACKYVPYGPLDLVLPYLLRRAQENVSALTAVLEDTQYFQNMLGVKIINRLKLSF